MVPPTTAGAYLNACKIFHTTFIVIICLALTQVAASLNTRYGKRM
jgi:hypothetical protein